MAQRTRSWLLELTTGFALLLIGFSLGAVSSARASVGRASTTTLQAILDAVNALGSGLRPPSNDQTRLLFSFAAVTPDFNSVFYVSNAGKDPSGITGHSGDCSLEAFGNLGTFSVGSMTVPAGETLGLGLVEGLLPPPGGTFVGYVVATCDFPLAHGTYAMALASEAGFRHLVPAVVLPPARSAEVVESLGH